jgi:hypothetical protein
LYATVLGTAGAAGALTVGVGHGTDWCGTASTMAAVVAGEGDDGTDVMGGWSVMVVVVVVVGVVVVE